MKTIDNHIDDAREASFYEMDQWANPEPLYSVSIWSGLQIDSEVLGLFNPYAYTDYFNGEVKDL